ncbi:hypothetical protein LSH36_130g03028 [Paralvinella palmiformis]|uniref:Uncharacterized protein n=1 Tax=Paralvinella palmiformis TaxID=53620 RepID=A0AAD9JWK5_9ANNE|nr:hypothetical protein LSH36_130g03028 [Paralvinella palmiformis]
MIEIRRVLKILLVAEIYLTVSQLVLLSIQHKSDHSFLMAIDSYTRSSQICTPKTADHNHTAIAIGLAITMKNLDSFQWTDPESSAMPLLSSFLVGFCRTASPGYDYRMYLAYDTDDEQFGSEQFRYQLSCTIYTYVHRSSSPCPKASTYSVKYIPCEYSGKPAWAQNDAMVAAYVDGAEYFYRVNDDTLLQTAGWTEQFVLALWYADPPNVGVVGPRHKGGNERILTYDFVHRSHIEIFGFYYPRIYETWYADDWITDIYQPGRTMKLPGVRIKHTNSLGRRYELSEIIPKPPVNIRGDEMKEMLFRYVRTKSRPTVRSDPGKVISMAIWNNGPGLLWGAIRNAQLRYVLYPGWTLRVYLFPDIMNTPTDDGGGALLNWMNVVKTLTDLGVDVRLINKSQLTPNMPLSTANLLAMDDPSVSVVLFRHPEMRFSRREISAVGDWLDGGYGEKLAHCMRDSPGHANVTIVPGLLAMNLTAFRIKYGKSLTSVLSGYFARHRTMKLTTDREREGYIYKHIWDLLRDDIVCHDSVSFFKWNSSVAFPRKGDKLQFVGQYYSLFTLIKYDDNVWCHPHPDCINV